MRNLEEMRSRIANKGIQGNDIKIAGLLTDDEIADLPIENVHTWIMQGIWKQKDFKKWLKVLRVI
jgi:hypothetical protein